MQDQMRRLRRATTGVFGAALALLLFGMLMIGPAQAVGPTSLEVGSDTTGAVEIETLTYADARNALNTTDATKVALDVLAMPQLTATDTELNFDDTNFELAVVSAMNGTTALGQSGQLVLTATWANGVDTDPTVAVFVRFESVALDAINAAWTGIDVSFGPAIVGVGGTAHDVAPNAVLGTDAFFADAAGASFSVTPNGIGFSGSVSAGAVADAAGELGVTGAITVTGALDGSLGSLAGDPPTGGLSLAVDLTVSPGLDLGWMQFGDTLSLSLDLNSSGEFEAGFQAAATLTPDDTTTVAFTVGAVINDAGDLTLSAALTDPVSNLFGQSWLELTSAEIAATIADGSFTGGISGQVVVGPVTGVIAVDYENVGGDIAASLSVSAENDGLSAAAILQAIGANVDPNDTLLNLTLNTVELQVDVSAPAGGAREIIAAVFADSSITVGTGTFNAALILRTDGTDVLAGASIESPTLQQLDAGIPYDWQLPDVAFVFSTADFDSTFDDLDGPSQRYFGPILCEDGVNFIDCDDLEVVAGLEISADVELPEEWLTALSEIGIDIASGETIRIVGTLPLFGGDAPVSLEVQLPEFTAADDDIIESGQISFFIAANPTTATIEAGITGDMVFRVTRSDAGDCDGSQDGNWPIPNANECYDTLNLAVTFGIEASPPEVTLLVTGTVSEWDNAFGQDWLDVNTLRLELSIGVTAAGGAEVGIGFFGSVEITGGGRTTNLVLAFDISVVTTPPWLKVNGLTAGSQAGISLPQIANMFNLPVDDLPDLSLRNMFFAWGVQDNPDLCIRAGLLISAELHFNAADDGELLSCADNLETLLPQDPADLAGCQPASGDTCLAGILIDIDFNTPSLTGAATLAGFDIGPITFDDTNIALVVSADTQRFAFSGGATLRDPVTNASDWASGQLAIDLSNDAGDVSLDIDALVNLGGADGLAAHVTGSAAADFTTLDGPIEDFIGSLKFDLSASLTFPGLEALGQEIDATMQDVEMFAEDVGGEIDDFFAPGGDLEQGAKDFVDLFDLPTSDDLAGMVTAWQSTRTAWQRDLDAAHSDVSTYLGKPAADALLAPARTALATLGDIEALALYGGEIVIFEGYTINNFFTGYTDVVIIPKISINIVGACGDGTLRAGHPICALGAGNPPTHANVGVWLLDPLVRNEFNNATVVSLPNSRPAIQSVQMLDDAYTTSAFSVVCAEFDLVYNGANGDSRTEVVVGLNTFGTDAFTSQDIDLAQGATGDADPNNMISQGAVDDVLGVDGNGDTCAAPSQPAFAGGTTLVLSADAIDEGQSVTASGAATEAGLLTVNFGNGDTRTVTVGVGQAWSFTSLYPDDTGSGATTNFLVEAKVSTAVVSRSARVSVSNVAPVIDSITVDSVVLDEGSVLNVSGTFTDVGVQDTHIVDIAWGDGTFSSIPAAGATSFSTSHTFVDDNPSITPSDDVVLQVSVRDNDGGADLAVQDLTINNVEPSDLTLDSATVDGLPVSTDPAGRLIVPEGQAITWSVSVTDIGTADTVMAAIDFGDGSPMKGVPLTQSGSDPTLWSGEVTHIYLDDEPTGTASDVHTVTIRATDDDSGDADATDEVLVVNVAPDLSVEPVAGQFVQYSDPIVDVVLTAVDTSGLVDPADPPSFDPTEPLSGVIEFSVNGGLYAPGVPNGMTFSGSIPTCTEYSGSLLDGPGQQCVFSVSGIADVAPGTYTLRFTVADDDLGVSVLRSVIVVRPEDADVAYGGPRLIATPDIGGAGTMITLRATVRDISSADPADPRWDPYAGDITNATVDFVNRDSGEVLCSSQVGQMFAGNTDIGSAQCDWLAVDADEFTLGVVVGGWYTRDDAAEDVSVAVSQPAVGPMSARGFYHVFPAEVVGTFAADDGPEFDYKVNVRARPRTLRLLGKTELHFAHDGTSYELRMVDYTTRGAIQGGAAEFSGTADLYEVGRGRATLVTSGLQVEFRMTDNGTPPGSDTSSWTVWDGGTLVLSTGYDGLAINEAVADGNHHVNLRVR